MRVVQWSLGMALAATIGVAACGGSEPAPTTPASTAASSRNDAPVERATPKTSGAAQPLDGKPRPDMPPPGSSLERVMRAHFKDALLIRQAVIAGTPDQAVEPAKILAVIENLDDLPPGWRTHVERMQQAARRIANSTSTASVASAAADLGVACGQCHQQLGGPAVSSEPPPPAGATTEQRMKRHAWAAERLWEGLVVPSSKAWNAGATALIDTPFPDDVMRRGVDARTAATDFKALVEQAPTEKVVEERAALYAALSMTCATCHRADRP